MEAGEISAFRPNSAGKTTTIKMIVGLLTPDSGRCWWMVAMWCVILFSQAADGVPIIPIFRPAYRREYLNFMGDVYGVPAAERAKRIESLLGMFELRARSAT